MEGDCIREGNNWRYIQTLDCKELSWWWLDVQILSWNQEGTLWSLSREMEIIWEKLNSLPFTKRLDEISASIVRQGSTRVEEVQRKDLALEGEKTPELRLPKLRNTSLKWCTAGVKRSHWGPPDSPHSSLPLAPEEIQTEQVILTPTHLRFTLRGNQARSGCGKMGIAGSQKFLNV